MSGKSKAVLLLVMIAVVYFVISGDKSEPIEIEEE